MALAVPVLRLGHGSKAGPLSRMSCEHQGLEYFTKDKRGEEMTDQGVYVFNKALLPPYFFVTCDVTLMEKENKSLARLNFPFAAEGRL